MTSSRSPMVSIPAVTRDKSVKGLLTAGEKSEFEKLVARLGMNQQDVFSRIILWLMDQHEDIQNIVVRPSVFEPTLRDPITPNDPAYEYKIIEDWKDGNPDSKFELDEFGKRGWELVCVCTVAAIINGCAAGEGKRWYFKRQYRGEANGR